MGAAAAALVTALLGLAIIPWLRKLHFGQTILEIGPKWHEKKQGTPTMGGLMFIFGTIAAVAVTVITDKLLGGDIVDSSATGASIIELYTKFYSGIIFALCVALIGFADDYIKVVKKRNLGLTEKQKTILQSLVIIAYLVSLYMGMGKEPYMFIPFAGNVRMGVFFWIFGFVVIYAAINAVNFTDGIDGLCSSVTITFGLSMCVIAYMHKFFGRLAHGERTYRRMRGLPRLEPQPRKGVHGRHGLDVPRRHGRRYRVCAQLPAYSAPDGYNICYRGRVRRAPDRLFQDNSRQAHLQDGSHSSSFRDERLEREEDSRSVFDSQRCRRSCGDRADVFRRLRTLKKQTQTKGGSG